MTTGQTAESEPLAMTLEKKLKKWENQTLENWLKENPEAKERHTKFFLTWLNSFPLLIVRQGFCFSGRNNKFNKFIIDA